MDAMTGQVAVITGASSPLGIGAAMARRFARAGASLLLVAEAGAPQLAALADECAKLAPGARAETAVVDLSIDGAAEAMIVFAVQQFGRVDVLVNNAAVRSPVEFGAYTREQFDESIAVNLAAPFFASQAVLPIMRAQGGGRIIHMASQLGHVTFGQRALYGLTKAALIHLTKSMAFELAKYNILVNAISPGPIATQASLDRGAAANESRIERYLPIGRLGQADEVAELAFFLAVNAPAFLQGQDLVIDGGYIIH